MKSMHCEVLEMRQLLSGSMTAEVIDGDLVIHGDAADNWIIIDQEGLPAGSVRIMPQDTSVNGETSLPTVLTGVAGGIRMDLGAGNDRVHIQDIDIAGGLEVQGGAGGDTVLIARCDIAGDLLIQTARHVDTVEITDSTIDGESSIFTGRAGDLVSLDGNAFAGATTIATYKGSDSIATGNSTFASGCNLDAGTGDNLTTINQTLRLEYDFTQGEQGWQNGIANSTYAGFNAGIRDLPAELGQNGTGYMLESNNANSDVFMFLKRGISLDDGLMADTRYRVTFDITFASNAPSGASGSPGEGVALRAGAGPIEPMLFGFEFEPSELNVGIDGQTGDQASPAGNIANGTSGSEFVSLRRQHMFNLSTATAVDGNLWLLAGTDSRYAGTTTVYFKAINVRFIPVSSATPDAAP